MIKTVSFSHGYNELSKIGHVNKMTTNHRLTGNINFRLVFLWNEQ